MGVLALSADERVRDVRVSEDTLTVDLWTGGLFQSPWFGTRDYLVERQNSARIGRSPLLVMASAGPISMKISAPTFTTRRSGPRGFGTLPNAFAAVGT